MGVPGLKRMAGETRRITGRGWYEYGSERVSLSAAAPRSASFDAAIVVSREESEAHVRKMRGRSEEGKPGRVVISPRDLLSASAEPGGPPPLILNSGHPYMPGGGFERGTTGMEQTLCRSSTLHCSLSSPGAERMYGANYLKNGDGEVFFDDAFVLSPQVAVFRDAAGNLLRRPYPAAAATVPPPRMYVVRRLVSEADAQARVGSQLRRFLCSAAALGYRRLVLGAWGCGYCGHDAAAVARWFRTLLIDEGIGTAFDLVQFALPDDEKREAFAKAFSRDAEIVSPSSLPDREKTAPPDAPACRTDQETTADNLGYARGVMRDGTPFVAELYQDLEEGRDDVHLSVIYPYRARSRADRPTEGSLLDHAGFDGPRDLIRRKPWRDRAALDLGMTDLGAEADPETIRENVQRLVEGGLVSLVSTAPRAVLYYREDLNGRDVTRLDITLVDDGLEVATTPLEFAPFPRRSPLEN